MQQSAHSQSCNSPRALFNNLTWAGGSKIALYRHVFPLSLWCSLEIRPDHPCWHCVLALHEMHTIMQIELEVIKPCSSLKNPHSPCSILSPSPHSDSALMGCAVEKTHSFGWQRRQRLCSWRTLVIRETLRDRQARERFQRGSVWLRRLYFISSTLYF